MKIDLIFLFRYFRNPKRIYRFIWNYRVLKKHGVNYVFKDLFGMNGRMYIYGRNKSITLGEGFTCNSGKTANPIGGSTQVILNSGNGTIIFGKHSGLANSAIVSGDSTIIIGDYVNIGGGCRIWATDFHSLNYEHRHESPDLHVLSKPIEIKNGAWIGGNTTILKGVVIGEKSIIGASSVVTKNVPDGEIWAGNPAHYIKKSP